MENSKRKPEIGMKVSAVKYERDRNGRKIVGKRKGIISQIHDKFIVVRLEEGYTECFKANELRYVKED